MNALLAEAKVPCGKVLERDEISEDAETDGALAIGQNQIVSHTAQVSERPHRWAAHAAMLEATTRFPVPTW